MNRQGLKYMPQVFENGWYCACGAFHPKEEDTVYCTECGCDRILLQNALNTLLQPEQPDPVPAAQPEAPVRPVQPAAQEEPTRIMSSAAQEEATRVMPARPMWSRRPPLRRRWSLWKPESRPASWMHGTTSLLPARPGRTTRAPV